MPSATQLQPLSRRRSRSISDIERAAICRYRRHYPSVSSAAVTAWAREELGITASHQTVSRLIKKAKEASSVNPLMILHNILDEYTHGLIGHNEVQANTHTEKETVFQSPASTKTNGKIDTMDSQTCVSLVAVKKYLQAWISHLQDTNDPEKELLVNIAEKHLQVLEKNILNTKIQTTIHCYFKQIN